VQANGNSEPQILIQVQGNAYELQEIFGIEQFEDAENSKECVICM